MNTFILSEFLVLPINHYLRYWKKAYQKFVMLSKIDLYWHQFIILITFTKRLTKISAPPPGHVPIIIQNKKKVFTNVNFGVFWIILSYQSCWCSLLPLICATEKRLTKYLWWFSKIDLYWQINHFIILITSKKRLTKISANPPPLPRLPKWP